ncbi:M42 family peptidase [Pseudomonas typographi]|uniref:M42 family peptidase n=1 Tax=Pseudomonas typographi TaxID=2715964 RepID=UPI001EEF3620|nr:M42 family peptidase [Pseudomonas typographi]
MLCAQGLGSEEGSVRQLCQGYLGKWCDDVWADQAGNLVGVLRAPATGGATQRPEAILVMAHLDEVAMSVKRVEADGTLKVIALGGVNPVNFGMCPVDILGAQATLPGVLSFGTMHATAESPQGADVQRGDVTWGDVHMVTRRSAPELKAAGVRPGTRVVLSRHWRKPIELADALAAHFMDDRAPLLATLRAAEALAGERGALRQDVYFAFSTREEESNAGALFAARHLPCSTAIAIEVGPVAAEYGTRLEVNPIIVAADEKGPYSRSVTDALIGAGERSGYTPQVALLVDFASDASAILASGVIGRAGCLAIPTENTHGFEIVLRDGISACAQVLATYLRG